MFDNSDPSSSSVNHVERKSTAPSPRNLYIAVFALVFIIWVFAIAFLRPHCSDLRCWADLGEASGTLGTLFSGLAFAGLLINIRLQHMEIRQQRSHFSLEQKISAREQLEQMSLSLYSEWHQMQNARDGLNAAVESLRKANRIITWRVLSGREPLVNDAERAAVFSVLHFFEKWAILKRHRRLDHDLLLNLIGLHLADIQSHLIDPLLRTDQLNNPDFAAVKLIHEQLLANSSAAPTFSEGQEKTS